MPGPRLWRIALAVAVLAALPRSSSASTQLLYLVPPRIPQVPVNGSGLLGYFNSVGELIDPTRDQVVGELIASDVSNNATFSVQLELDRHVDPTTIGLYNGYQTSPLLMEVFPSNAGPGWFAVVSYRMAPVRAVVNLFDNNAAFLGSRTYLGADRNGIGIYVAGPSGVLYSQDARNPGGAPKILFFKGTGINFGRPWICVESADADDDFDDTVLFIEANFGSVTPVHRATWSALKARFR